MTATSKHPNYLFMAMPLTAMLLFFSSCTSSEKPAAEKEIPIATIDSPEYFSLRPSLEKMYGYTHAVKIGDDIKISGAVSMDTSGNLLAKGNMEQQMKNCYADLEIILKHYGCTFDDVVVENILTTDMQEFIRVSGYRNSIYKKQFPTGSWMGVKELALVDQLIEIELEAHISKK